MRPYIPHVAVGGAAFLPNTIISLSRRTTLSGFLFRILCAAGMPHLLQLRTGMLKHTSIHTPRCSRRFGIPAEHYHKSFLTNNMIRLSISNLLCGRNAAPPTIANWHAKAYFHAYEVTQASLPATRLEDAPCK